MARVSRLLFGVVGVLMLAACGTPADTSPVGGAPAPVGLAAQVQPARVSGTLRAGEYTAVIDGREIGNAIVQEGDPKLTFSAGCNTIRATLIDGVLSQGVSTEMWCEGRMEDEALLKRNLADGPFTFVNDSEFTVGDISFTWHPEPELPSAPPDGEYTIGLEELKPEVDAVLFMEIGTATVSENGTQLNFYAGCNQIGAPLTDGVLGPVRSTRMLCQDNEQEPKLLENLENGEFSMKSPTSFRIGNLIFSKIS